MDGWVDGWTNIYIYKHVHIYLYIYIYTHIYRVRCILKQIIIYIYVCTTCGYLKFEQQHNIAIHIHMKYILHIYIYIHPCVQRIGDSSDGFVQFWKMQTCSPAAGACTDCIICSKLPEGKAHRCFGPFGPLIIASKAPALGWHWMFTLDSCFTSSTSFNTQLVWTQYL